MLVANAITGDPHLDKILIRYHVKKWIKCDDIRTVVKDLLFDSLKFEVKGKNIWVNDSSHMNYDKRTIKIIRKTEWKK